MCSEDAIQFSESPDALTAGLPNNGSVTVKVVPLPSALSQTMSPGPVHTTANDHQSEAGAGNLPHVAPAMERLEQTL